MGVANDKKLLVTIASPLSSDAIMRSSELRSCAADSMIAVRSGLSSMPKRILVLRFARISRGMREGSWVIAMSPTLNLRPSRAMVEKMLGPRSRTSLPRTRGASSRTIETTGFVFMSESWKCLWRSRMAVAMSDPMRISTLPWKVLVSMMTVFESSRACAMSAMVVLPACVSKIPLQSTLLFSSRSRKRSCIRVRLMTARVPSWNCCLSSFSMRMASIQFSL